MPDLSHESIELNREFGPWQYDWRALIERYLEAVDNAFPWHRERSPWGPPVAPPTLLGNATLRFLDSIAPVPPGTLHAKFDLEITNALRGDRELVGYGRFIEKYERRGRRWAAFTARWRDGPGLLVAHATVTVAFPERVETKDEPANEPGERRAPGKAELTRGPRALTREKIIAYSEDSANHERGQSIHTDLELARSFGFPDLVAQALMSPDYISHLITGRFERGWLLQGRLSLAFVAPSFAAASTRHVHDAWCENQRGETVTVGTAAGVVAAEG